MKQQSGQKAGVTEQGGMGGSRKVRKGFAVLQGALGPSRPEAGQQEGRAMEGTSQDSYTLGGWCGPGCRGKRKNPLMGLWGIFPCYL